MNVHLKGNPTKFNGADAQVSIYSWQSWFYSVVSILTTTVVWNPEVSGGDVN